MISVKFFRRVTDGQGTKWHRNIAENFNRLSRVHERYRRQTDRRTTTYREREHEISQGCAFWGFVKKFSPTSPQIPKILHYKCRFSLKTRINLGGSAGKIHI